MTTAQKLKEAKAELTVWRERKHFLANGERAVLNSEITRLTALVEDRKDTYTKLEYYMDKSLELAFKNGELQKENKMLKRKLTHIHDFYKRRLDETKRHATKP